ncbi:MAG: outer membrane lipoprotein carrier protein LolA [Gammaproteobacteria bacterium]|nr:outer membrane lipoprotein carrier protein LolA [Gammaproteobacteria bacterium]
MRLIVVAVAWLACTAVAEEMPASQMTFAEVAAQLAAPAVLRGNFTQRREIAILQKPLLSSGYFILSDKGLYWRQDHPIAALMIADNERLMQQIADGPLQDINTAENPVVLSFSKSFLSIFRGSETELRENFDLEFVTDVSDWTIHLTPISYPMSAAIESIVLQGRQHIETITVQSRSSEKTTIRFADLLTEPDRLSDNELELYAR